MRLESVKTGKVDVLTLSPIFLPDEGIEKFTNLALEHNKDVRVCVQPIRLRWDVHEPTMKRPEKVDHNAITGEELRKRHEPYFKSMDEHIKELNKKQNKTVLFEVPAPQAVIALREKIIAGEATSFRNPGVDSFAGTNVLALVVELPSARLGGTKLGVWGTTSRQQF